VKGSEEEEKNKDVRKKREDDVKNV
jgi:hypothetical protein